MSRNYYCLVAGMPEIAFDQKKLFIKQDELKQYLNEALNPIDFKQLEYLYLEYDNTNILKYISKGISISDNQTETSKFNSLSVYSFQEISDAFKNSNDNIASYILNFIEDYNNSEKKDNILFWEKHLSELYYDYVKRADNQFIRQWFEFEFMLKTSLTAIISRKYSLDIENQLIIDDEITQSIAKSNAKDFGLTFDWQYITKILNIIDNDNLLKREEDIDMLKWNWIDETTIFEYFSFEVVVSILLKLRIIERWVNADPEKGKALFITLLDDVKKSAVINN